MKVLSSLALLALVLLSGPALAVIETYQFSSPELEQRYQLLSSELRCPKCQNQNLADSDAPIAADLRGEIRRLLEEGRSDDEIAAHLVARYGEFVLYRPAVKGNTLVLWYGPAALALLGLVALALVVRRHRRDAPDSAPLDPAEQQRLEALLKGDDREPRP